MARNKSEKSPSGDPMVDEALRAWLRWHRSFYNRGPQASVSKLMDLECRLYDRLSPRQRRLRSDFLDSGVDSYHEGLMKAFGREPEFQNGTQSK